MLAVILVGSTLAAAPSALAATPFTVSADGDYPGIAVDAAGRAHVAFNNRTTTPDRTGYCRVPRGATGCSDLKSFGPEGDDPGTLFASAQVFERAGTVDVLSYRCCSPEQVQVKRSTNGGDTFGTRQLLASGGFVVAELYDAVPGPGGSYSWVDRGGDFQNALPGAPASTSADLGDGYAGTVGLHGGVPVVVYQGFSNANPQKDYFWRMYDGSGPRNDATNWTAQQLVAAGNGHQGEARLAEGPNGLFLATLELSRPHVDGQRLRVDQFLSAVDEGRVRNAKILDADAVVVGEVVRGGRTVRYNTRYFRNEGRMDLARVLLMADVPTTIDQQVAKAVLFPALLMLLPALIIVLVFVY
ncbi:MAG: hypothetical protein KY433_05845, partial [Actinobacteria bacterium]|nr:hypothetical protein [Actinomycetota bacterium]